MPSLRNSSDFAPVRRRQSACEATKLYSESAYLPQAQSAGIEGVVVLEVGAFYTLCSPVIDKRVEAIFISEGKRNRLPLTFHSLTIRATSTFAEDILAKLDLTAYARRGAEARIAELTAEL